jgi:GDP-mannose 6-dehydrogenase
VGTPSLPNGRLDLSSIKNAATQVGRALREKNGFHLIALRSTMLPGTARESVIPVLEATSGKRAARDFAVCVNPEFTREGSAVTDFMHPPLTVVGAVDPDHARPVCELHREITPYVFETSLEVAEMVKYVCNAFHALKVTFANEMGTICRRLNVDERAVMEIFAGDTKLNISAAYLTPGFAFGGSCLPKDLRAISYCAKQLDLTLPLLQSINPSNQAHLERALATLLSTRRKKIAVLGLSFKCGTDDLRESPSVQLIKRLLGEGRHIRIWDPDVSLGRLVGSNLQFIEEEIPHIASLLATDLKEVIDSAEVVVLATNALDIHELLALCRAGQVVVDLHSADPAPVDVESIRPQNPEECGLNLPQLAGATVS